MSASKTALVLGATGLVGTALLKQLHANDQYSKIKILTRHPISNLADFPKIEALELNNFDQMQTMANRLSADDVFCTLGTTMKKAGSKAAFYTVDFSYPVALAQLALKQGAKHFIIVTASGANVNSRIFYNRVKGEVEQALKMLNYPRLTILRPSLLTGERQEYRFGESVAQVLGKVFAGLMPVRMKPISAELVASAMIRVAQNSDSGIQILESEVIRQIGQ